MKQKMMILEGAEELRSLVLKKWRYRVVKRYMINEEIVTNWLPSANVTHYLAKFSCPRCGSEIVESFMDYKPDDLREGKEWWFIEWDGNCPHLDRICRHVNEEACTVTPVEENGVIVGTIEPISPPEWPRYECSSGTSNPNPPCAFFGTLWQAMHASLDECRLLATIQAEKKGGVKRR